MADFVLSCCSTADLTKEHFQQRDISYICFHYALDGVDYPDDLGETMPFDKFYAAMANGAETRTSQVNISEFVDYFTPFLEQGKDILHVCLSSGLSGVSNSAENAARIVRERYPDRKIYIVDSLGASSGYGLLMDRLADLRDEGMPIDGVRDWAEAHKLELHHWFFSTDLTFYVKGGRISKVAGVFGGLLDICPLLNMDNLGRLIPRSKIRGKKRVMKEIVARMEEHAQGGLDYSGKCYISQSACYDDARAVADEIEKKFPKLNGKVEIYSVANLHAGCVEIFVGEGARVRYSTIENWSKNMYNLNTKRARVEKGGTIEWVSGSFGSHTGCLYPMSVLQGEGARMEFTGITFAGAGQDLDTGAKVVHAAPNTTSHISTKSIARDGGVSNFRSSVVVLPNAKGSKSSVSCESLMLDDRSRSDTIPAMDIRCDAVDVGHEAKIGRISEEAIFYLMSRGMTEEDARALIVGGFAEPIAKELPLEYAVEMNNLIHLEMKGSIG